MRLRLVLLLLLFLPQSVAAQGVVFQRPGADDDPVTIEADDGIEWRQNEKLYIARGNALAARGDFSVRADELRASYQETSQGRTEVTQVEAIGNVYIETAEHRGTAEKGVYRVQEGMLRLTGDNLTLKTAVDTITARDYIQYNEKTLTAEARGKASVLRENNHLEADRLVAHFKRDREGQLQVDYLEALGGVTIATPQERIVAGNGRYAPDSGIVILSGDVRINRDKNQLTGDRAEVNLNTGVSRLLAGSPNTRVRGVFTPGSGS